MKPYTQINGQRLLKRLDDFAAIGATPAGGVNRQALSPEDRTARSLLASLAIERGFAVFQDDMANLFIRREGKNKASPPFLVGSHLDSQPTGGRYDGALGTLAAFEVLETLEDEGIETDAPIEVVAWTNEEGSRFAPGTMGSMAFSLGQIPEEWHGLRGTDGVSFDDALTETLSALPAAHRRTLGFPILGYLELHIEQGPMLEKENIPIGIVTGVQGTRWLDVTVTGQAAHAGTTQLAFRRDPMVAVASALHMLHNTIMPMDDNARLTVGRIAAFPGSINAIPGSVNLTLDLRHPQSDRLDAIEAEVLNCFQAAAAAQSCQIDLRKTFDMSPASFSSPVINGVEAAAGDLGLAFKPMVSGAFHDALYISRLAPTAMIFVPCRDGLSHNEDEYVEPEHSVAGAQILFQSAMKVLDVLAINSLKPEIRLKLS
ncbi:Zn-dependent hydrolase [Agrobacterium rubi]|uniref:Zn-dependent hydrolase n=1 Tax=Agrobacterium rubi TaxID=28099 RepID=A0AAE7R6W6_9HYPH|nr:Zn-dependent hydrolase [Agrobacterium rubi]NTE88392.1 Zn-dependent hydrolase [Agrobacterium rubi]NTF04158.1 Zn-dependent hydrolase [Agrobacterium rubi]NTF38489.1 Zn-dependent hydrolase [Agrobacterium rubi]OCJ47152.1 Zn-dependent hydrolase [Agrobacterium rubi]QTG02294.1 Zn-dependent hydrolase [Agrobacterium rubi]